MSVNVFNRCWARVILESLVRHGVSHFCIAPGSRSTPLTLEAARLQENRKALCYTHFDERGLGFFALGIAKSIKKNVAIIVTSGTAVANLYPAIIEARQTGVNLIILTADRPPELIECGANQAILQQNIFGTYPTASLNLPRPTDALPASWLLSELDQAYIKQNLIPGVIHINVPFAEPLYLAKEEDIAAHYWLKPIEFWLNSSAPWILHEKNEIQVQEQQYWEHWRAKQGVILVGRLPAEQAKGISLWANTMGWIMLTDIQSHVTPSLPYADIWLANETVQKKLLSADIVLQFGEGFVSKRINQFINNYQGEYWIVSNQAKNIDPAHHYQTRFIAKPSEWIKAHPPLRQKPWILEPLALSKFCSSFIEEQLGGGLNEASLSYHLERLLFSNGSLFLGNSLVVRLADALTKLPDGYPVYTNRGASGIDGLLATAAGIATGSNQPLIAILGDTSLLYDLNSLALIQKANQPTVIIVINNNGGAIFDTLPVDEHVKDKYYRMPHNLDFSQAAAMFNLKYARPLTWPDFMTALKQVYTRRSPALIEIKVGQNDGGNFYQNLIEQISYAVVGDEE